MVHVFTYHDHYYVYDTGSGSLHECDERTAKYLEGEPITLTDGELICSVAEGGALYQVDNGLSVSVLAGDAAVLSPAEAYARLREGRFARRDVPAFNALAPGQVHVTACELAYMTDSKGFRQPVYTFTLADDRSAELRGSGNWTTFVPALA